MPATYINIIEKAEEVPRYRGLYRGQPEACENLIAYDDNQIFSYKDLELRALLTPGPDSGLPGHEKIYLNQG